MKTIQNYGTTLILNESANITTFIIVISYNFYTVLKAALLLND